MTSRSLKITLALSVAVNIFALASGAALWISRERVDERVSEAHKTVRQGSVRELIQTLDPKASQAVLEGLRKAAIEARPDFDQARRARKQAIELTEQDSFRAVEVATLLEQSRASEIRGRAHLEANAVSILATLSQEDRTTLAPILSRHGSRNGPGCKSVCKQSKPAEDQAAQSS